MDREYFKKWASNLLYAIMSNIPATEPIYMLNKITQALKESYELGASEKEDKLFKIGEEVWCVFQISKGLTSSIFKGYFRSYNYRGADYSYEVSYSSSRVIRQVEHIFKTKKEALDCLIGMMYE